MRKNKQRSLSFILSILMFSIAILSSPNFSLSESNGSRSIIQPPANTNTYEFYLNEADADPAHIQIIKDGEYLEEPEDPEALPNKKFIGWYEEEEMSPIDFSVPIEVTETKTIKVYAKYESIVYVKFIYNDEVLKTKELPQGEAVNDENVPIVVLEQGKVFSHWSSVPNGPEYDFNSPVNSDINLYAVLTDKWTVTFDSQGGSAVLPAFIVNGQSVAASSYVPQKAGYAFKWWSTVPGGNIYSDSTPVTNSMTLYAVWEPNADTPYKVIYYLEDANSAEYHVATGLDLPGGYGIADMTGTTGTDAVYTPRTYTGFSLNTGLTDAASVTINGDGTTIRKVYYDRNRHTLEFRDNSNTVLRTYPGIKQGQDTAQWWNEASALYPTFNWCTTLNGNTMYSEAPDMPDRNLTVYGRAWGNTSYIIYYRERIDGENTTIDIKTPFHLTGPSGLVLTIEDYIAIPGFTVFSTLADGSREPVYNTGTGNWEWKIYYTRNNYDIIFQKNDGTGTSTVGPVAYQENISDKALSGYDSSTTKVVNGLTYYFAGWFDNAACLGDAFDFTGKTMPANNVELYAKWVPNTHKVTVYKTSDPTGEKIVYDGIAHGGKVTDVVAIGDLQKTIPSGLTEDDFKGWYWYPSSHIFVKFDFNMPVYDDIELYPAWGNIIYSITYDTNGGLGSVTDDGAYLVNSYAVVKSANGLIPPEGKVFLGWTDEQGNIYHANDKFKMTKNSILTAKWGDVAKVTQLTYKPNGASGEDQVVNMSNNSNHTIREIMYERAGYRFESWNTKPDGSGTRYTPDTLVMVDVLNQETENVLYAQWIELIDITGNKVWVVDSDDEKEDIQFQLYKDGVPEGEPITLVKGESSYTWQNLDKTGSNGEEYTYTIDEVSVPNGFRKQISEDGLTITNFKKTFMPGTGGFGFSIFNLISAILILLGLIVGYKKFYISKKK